LGHRRMRKNIRPVLAVQVEVIRLGFKARHVKIVPHIVFLANQTKAVLT